jgi:hypothetical protein
MLGPSLLSISKSLPPPLDLKKEHNLPNMVLKVMAKARKRERKRNEFFIVIIMINDHHHKCFG